MKKAVIFGAGNIGRSFIGSIFSSNGLHVVFVDADPALVREINRKKQYRIIIKKNETADRELLVKNITALHSSEEDKIVSSLVSCDICATAVGQGALPKVVPLLAKGIKERLKHTSVPLDIIIAENIRGGADYFKQIMEENGLTGNEAGLVETSIGKMVPIMKQEDLKKDPLVLYAEEYNTLILDKKGFKNSVPGFPEIKAVENIAAWVDRKLFIHNLGHVASAYLGFYQHPGRKTIPDVLEDSSLREMVRKVMTEAAAALLMEYPEDFTEKGLREHREDLLARFQNKALGDTVFRVGRDLHRKLGKDDRILGAARLCMKHGVLYEEILTVFEAAFHFKAVDQTGKPFYRDSVFFAEYKKAGFKSILLDICGLDSEADDVLIQQLRDNHENA